MYNIVCTAWLSEVVLLYAVLLNIATICHGIPYQAVPHAQLIFVCPARSKWKTDEANSRTKDYPTPLNQSRPLLQSLRHSIAY